ncbi:MAG TPA: universal stress protein [Chthoniobacterales bacterium]|nr:universal stress protein [Chthoniobacterales bacterium]
MNSTITLPKPQQSGIPAAAKAKALRIRNILIATDFSPASLRAAEAALPLMKSFNAEFHFIHVVPPDHSLSMFADMPMILPDAEVRRRIHRRLQETATKFSVPLRPKNAHVLKGRPFEQVCQLARDLNIDLIVTATRGHTGLKHLTLGSTAERIVRYSPCPVVVVRPPRRRAGDKKLNRMQFKRILVPVDFSDCSEHGLNYARALANRFGAELVLLNSVALEYYVSNDEYARYDFPQLARQAEAAARRRLQDLVEKTKWNGVHVRTRLEIGHAGQQICDRAEDLGIDLIVTSSHGRTGFKHVLVGSTAEYVVRHAPCSVLVVPSHERILMTSKTKKL